MQLKVATILLASTAISQVAAGPMPLAFQDGFKHLQSRDDQTVQAQAAAAQQANANAAQLQNAQAATQDTQKTDAT